MTAHPVDSVSSHRPSNSREQGRILIIRGGAIGDFILTLPVLAALRAHFPDARLEVLGYGHIAELAMHGGLVQAVRSIEARALAGFFARRGTLAAELAAYFRNFNVILSYLYDPDGIFEENVRRCTDAQFIAGPHRPDEAQGKHAAECLLEPLQRLAVFEPDPRPRLCMAAPSTRVELSSPRIAMHPGSGSDRKNWPEPHWKAVVDRMLSETNADLLLVGGEAEGDRLERLAQGLPTDRIEVLRQRPLVEVGRRLTSCLGFVGHDSGITHLAAALRVPCLVLWGESREAVWRPLGPVVEILRSTEGLSGITVESVCARAKQWLEARPSCTSKSGRELESGTSAS